MEEIKIEKIVPENDDNSESGGSTIIIVIVIIVIIIGGYLWLNGISNKDLVEVPEEEQTLVDQISNSVNTDNPVSDVPQTNVFETETNPFKDDGFKNPFE